MSLSGLGRWIAIVGFETFETRVIPSEVSALSAPIGSTSPGGWPCQRSIIRGAGESSRLAADPSPTARQSPRPIAVMRMGDGP